MNNINYKVWTLCMIQDGDRVLMLNRNHDHFQGYIPPGGKLEFPESPVEGAIREVKEETGLGIGVMSVEQFHPPTTDPTETPAASYKLRYEQETRVFTSLESLHKTLSQ